MKQPQQDPRLIFTEGEIETLLSAIREACGGEEPRGELPAIIYKKLTLILDLLKVSPTRTLTLLVKKQRRTRQPKVNPKKEGTEIFQPKCSCQKKCEAENGVCKGIGKCPDKIQINECEFYISNIDELIIRLATIDVLEEGFQGFEVRIKRTKKKDIKYLLICPECDKTGALTLNQWRGRANIICKECGWKYRVNFAAIVRQGK